MASIDLRSEAKRIVDGLSDETLSIAVSLLTALKAQKPMKQADQLSGLHRSGPPKLSEEQ